MSDTRDRIPRAGRIPALRLVGGTSFRVAPALTVVSLLSSAIAMGAQPIFAYGTKVIVQSAISGHGHRAIVVVALMGIGAILTGVCSWGGLKLQLTLEDKVGLALDTLMVEALGEVPSVEHHERPELLDRVDLVRQSRGELAQTIHSLAIAAGIVFQLTVTAGVMASVSPWLLVLPAFAVPSLLASSAAQRRAQNLGEALAEPIRLADTHFQLGTAAPPASELRVFGLGDELLDRHERLWADIKQRNGREAMIRSGITSIGWGVFGLGFVGSLAFVAGRVDGPATIGNLVLTLTVAATLNSQVTGAVGIITWLLGCLKTVGRLMAILAHVDGVHAELAANGAGTAPAPARLDQGIVFEGVSFAYPGTDEPVLANLDLTIPAGTRVAIVGDNGAGKTTLVKLLCRFYEPTSGRILIDGVPLAAIEPAEWRARMSAGFQDFARFELTAGEGVGLGHLPSIDDEGAQLAALERASAVAVLDALPNGLGTQVGRTFDDGVELSGGQWQKLALGRAMARPDPLVLLLDEPTAALDPQAEHDLFQGYAAAAAAAGERSGAVTVFVSHRFSTVRMADLILVVHDRRVTEHGTHDELVALGGTYASLYELQAAQYR